MAEEVTPGTADLINLTLESPDLAKSQNSDSQSNAGSADSIPKETSVKKSISKKKRKCQADANTFANCRFTGTEDEKPLRTILTIHRHEREISAVSDFGNLAASRKCRRCQRRP